MEMKEKEIGLITKDIMDKWKQIKRHLDRADYFFHIADFIRARNEVEQVYQLVAQIEQELRAAPRVHVELEEE